MSSPVGVPFSFCLLSLFLWHHLSFASLLVSLAFLVFPFVFPGPILASPVCSLLVLIPFKRIPLWVMWLSLILQGFLKHMFATQFVPQK